MRVAAAGAGLLLVVDDVHDADEASLRLLHYLSRCAVDERVLLLLAHRDPAPARVQDVTASMVSRGGGHLLELPPLTPGRRSACSWTGSRGWTRTRRRRSRRPGAGLPFPMIEMARARVNGSGAVSAVLPPAALRTFRRVALLGLTFSTDELLAVSRLLRGRDLRPAGAGPGRPGGRARRGRVPLPAPARAGGAGRAAAAAPAVPRAPTGRGGAGRAGASPGPGRPPLPRGGTRLARGALRRPGRGDGRSARCLPRRAGAGRRRTRATPVPSTCRCCCRAGATC